MRRQFRDRPAIASMGISLLVCAGVLGLRLSGGLEFLELAAYDWFIRLRPKVAAAESRLALIAITEDDIRKFSRWPLTDADLTQILTALVSYEPRAIGLDLYRDVPVPPGHEALNAVLTGHPSIMTVMKFGSETQRGVLAPAVLAGTPQVGFNDILVDPGGIVRRGLLFLDDGQQPAYAFALRLALRYLQAEGVGLRPDPATPAHLRLGAVTFRPLEAYDGPYIRADARGYQFWLDFRDAPDAVPTYTLDALLSSRVEAAALRGKIVLIGVTADSLKDFFYTPHSRGRRADHHMPGVIVHAHVVNQLLRAALQGHRPLAVLSEYQEALWLLVWSVLGGALALRRGPPGRFALMAFGGLCVLAGGAYAAFVYGWFLPLAPAAMAWVLAAGGASAYLSYLEQGERNLLMQLFARHVSPEVADAVWRQRDAFLHGGRPRPQKMTVTVLVTDLEGFTQVAERLDPQPLMDWLSVYMDVMTQLVSDHGGIVDDYAGDGLKADFGAPLVRHTKAEIRQDAVNAARCALAMEQAMARLHADFKAQDLPRANMRIGIYTGPVVAGSIGSAQRLKYTTIGDTVNTAARLENAAKKLLPEGGPCRILVGDATAHYLNDDFHLRRLGEVRLRGKTQPVTVYHLTE